MKCNLEAGLTARTSSLLALLAGAVKAAVM